MAIDPNRWKFLTIDEYPRELTYDNGEPGYEGHPYERFSFSSSGQGISIHWFDDKHLVQFLFEVQMRESPWEEGMVFEFWSLGSDFKWKMDSFEFFEYSSITGMNPESFATWAGSNFIKTSDPDLFFMYTCPDDHVDTETEAVSRAAGFYVSRTREVFYAGVEELFTASTISDIESKRDMSISSASQGALWLVETEYDDLGIAGMTVQWNNNANDDYDMIRRTLTSITLDPANKSFDVVDSTVFDNFRSSDDSQLLDTADLEASHCVFARDGRAAFFSWVEDRSETTHYLDTIDYTPSGAFSNKFRIEDNQLWQELNDERPEVWMYSFGSGGFGLPHAMGDRSKNLQDGRVLFTTDHWIEYYESARWIGYEFQTSDTGIPAPIDPKFGAPHPNYGNYENSDVLMHFIVDLSTRDIEWAGWDDKASQIVIPSTDPEDNFSGQSWDLTLRYVNNEAVWVQAHWVNHSGFIVGHYTFSTFDLSNIHNPGVYIKGSDYQRVWWSGIAVQNLPQVEPVGNEDEMRSNWHHSNSISPNGKLWFGYLELFEPGENDLWDFHYSAGDLGIPPLRLIHRDDFFVSRSRPMTSTQHKNAPRIRSRNSYT